MFKHPIFLTIITCGVFFFLATATSPPDDDFENFVVLNLSVEIIDSNLVIANNDTVNITNAFMTLEKPTGDSLNGTPVSIPYFVDGFNLNMGIADTFPMSVFTREDTLIYPIDTFPHAFRLDFQSDITVGFFNVEF